MSTHIWGEKESCSTLIIKLKNIDTIVIYSHSDTNFQWLMHLHPFKKKKINTWNKQLCKYYQKFLKLRFLM